MGKLSLTACCGRDSIFKSMFLLQPGMVFDLLWSFAVLAPFIFLSFLLFIILLSLLILFVLLWTFQFIWSLCESDESIYEKMRLVHEKRRKHKINYIQSPYPSFRLFITFSPPALALVCLSSMTSLSPDVILVFLRCLALVQSILQIINS